MICLYDTYHQNLKYPLIFLLPIYAGKVQINVDLKQCAR